MPGAEKSEHHQQGGFLHPGAEGGEALLPQCHHGQGSLANPQVCLIAEHLSLALCNERDKTLLALLRTKFFLTVLGDPCHVCKASIVVSKRIPMG